MAAPTPLASAAPLNTTMGDGSTTFPLERQSQISVVAVSIVFIIIPTIAVAMRLMARRMANRALDASDYCIIVACVFSHALQIVSIVSVTQGGVGYLFREIIPKYGRGPIIKFLQISRFHSSKTVSLMECVSAVQILVVQQILWAVSLSLCKIAILLLYTKLFSVRLMIIATRVMTVFTVIWTAVAVLVAFFICRPLSDNWLLDLKNRNCGNQPAADGTLGVVNLLTDIIVLIMPVSYLWRLRLETFKKIALIATFSLGVFTCIVSGLRLYYLANLKYTDVTFGIPNALIFSALEPGVGITLACIPFLRPLLGRSQYSTKGTARYYTSAENSGHGAGGGQDRNGFTLVEDSSSQHHLREHDQSYDMPSRPSRARTSKGGSARDSY
ncbi:uncharacterized protein CTRU02_200626 [Colletotrichum truncatum]|uniref:Integral membrane protein n=1 Tax=Colletotrichum truncatum TaxID=5467 RepID=A0ACC3ZF41_COLTU